MLLTKHNLIHYLLDKNLLQLDKIISGEYSVRSNDSRNINFLVNKEFVHHNYFVKQIKAKEQEKIDTINTEAACYMLTTNNPKSGLSAFFPKFYYYDKNNFILITEQVKDAVSLHEYYFTHFQFNNNIPAQLATILANLHKKEILQSIESSNDGNKITLKNQQPWVFTVTAKPLQYWITQPVSAEQQAMVLILKNVDFCNLINATPAIWQPNALLHNDIKFTNFLTTIKDNNTATNLKLVDWELADYGDNAWDVACLLHSYVYLWASTDLPEKELALQPTIKKVSLENVQFCTQQFWHKYITQFGIAPQMQYSFLLKVTKYVAMKLIHTCFETTPYSPTLQPNAVKLLQIAHNILKSPENAALHLLGIK